MMMKKKNRKVSSYWQEVSVLFTKAGAFGIVNLFNQPEVKRLMQRTLKPTVRISRQLSTKTIGVKR